MIIHLLRHAKAISRQEGIEEDHRYLTTEGRKRFHEKAARLRKEGLQPAVIVSSPLVRSVQTADLLASVLKFDGPLPISPLLAPGFGSEQLAQLLTEYAACRSLVLVGHEPDLSLLVATLLDIRIPFSLKKGDAVTLEFDADRTATFLWRTLRGKVVRTPPGEDA